MLKPLLFVSAVVLLGVAVSSASGPVHPEAIPAAPKPTAESQARAKEIYEIDCAICHSANGNGKSSLAKSMSTPLKDWTNPAVLAARSDALLYNIIRKGKGKMPSEDATRANDDEVWNLVLYIRGFSKPQPTTEGGATN